MAVVRALGQARKRSACACQIYLAQAVHSAAFHLSEMGPALAANIEACAQACKEHRSNPDGSGPFDHLPCNAFAWCGAEVCFEPDAHKHTLGDCWLKFTEAPARPELNMRGRLPDWYRAKHPNAPTEVQWMSGVLLPLGVGLTNGTWSVRWHW